MFAFAIWDAPRHRLLLARDRVGKKPLYFTHQGSRLAFASELKALLAAGEVERELDREAVDCYFTLGYVPSPRSILRQARKLPPAGRLVFDEQGLRQQRYWSLSFAHQATLSDGQATERLDELLQEAVRGRLMSEVPLGAFLSGGIDSSLVVGMMSQALAEPVKTHAIGFDIAAYDELPHAKAVAEACHSEHHEHTLHPDAQRVLPLLAWHFDEPLADASAIPTYYVCQMARSQVTVALSGDGGDEGFGGYTFRYRPHQVESRLRQTLPSSWRGLGFGLAGRVYPKWDWLPQPLRLKTVLSNLAVSDARAFYLDLSLMSPAVREGLYRTSFLDELRGFTPYEAVGPLYSRSDASDPVGRSQHADILSYMTDNVLVKVDRMSMAVSLEVRCPLLDHRVLEFAAQLPLEQRLRGNEGKWLLRQVAGRYVPRQVFDRPKQGFSPPVAEWLRGDLRRLGEDTLFGAPSVLRDYVDIAMMRRLWQDHQRGIRENSQILWCLLMFRLWEDNYLKTHLPPRPAAA
jgi:asparagine synthase (glutamine-hydrolysing)